jgi:hypothetical protein
MEWATRLAWAAALAAALSRPTGATTLTFDYSNATPGVTTTPFLQTVDGVTATFSSDQDPGGFEVDNSAAATFSGLVVDTSFASPTLATELIINFSEPVASISTPFMTDGPGPLLLQAYADAFPPRMDPVGSVSVSGTVPPFPAQFPEGVISFSGADFSSVVLSDVGDPAFAVGTLTVTLPTAVPEPQGLGAGMLLLLGFGALYRRRLRNRSQPRPRRIDQHSLDIKIELR